MAGTDECAGVVTEVVPGLVTWPVARPGEPVRFSVATIRPDVTVVMPGAVRGGPEPLVHAG